jgi:cation transport ATPase
MTCATCAVRIERVLGRQDGVRHANVNLAATSAEVEVDPGTDIASLSSTPWRRSDTRSPTTGNSPRDVAAQYHGDEKGPVAPVLAVSRSEPPGHGPCDVGPPEHWNYWLQFLLVTPVVFIPGWQYHRMAWKLARTFSANMDTFISLGRWRPTSTR